MGAARIAALDDFLPHALGGAAAGVGVVVAGGVGVAFGLIVVVVGFAAFASEVVVCLVVDDCTAAAAAGVAAGAVLDCFGLDFVCFDLDFAMVVEVSLFVVVNGLVSDGVGVLVLALSLLVLLLLVLLPVFVGLPHVDAGAWTDDPPPCFDRERESMDVYVYHMV